MSLSLEVIDVEVYKMAFSSSFFSKLFPIDQKHIDIWRRMQSRMVEALPRQLIFSSLNVLTIVPKNSNGSIASRRNKRSNGASSADVTNNTETNNNEFEVDTILDQECFTSIGPKRRCREIVYKHEDKEFCAADKCLRPYS